MSAADADRALVTRYLDGRGERAFRALYDAHADWLWAFALRLTGRREAEAEEVCQDAWMAAARHLDGFRWESAFRTWLGGITVNCWRRRLRKGSRDEAPLSGHERAPPAHPAGTVDLERALATLEETQRAVLLLYGVYGYRHAEIAEHLGIAVGTSRSHLSRAREALRRALANGRLGEEIHR